MARRDERQTDELQPLRVMYVNFSTPAAVEHSNVVSLFLSLSLSVSPEARADGAEETERDRDGTNYGGRVQP